MNKLLIVIALMVCTFVTMNSNAAGVVIASSQKQALPKKAVAKPKIQLTQNEKECLYLNAFFEGSNDTLAAHQGFIEVVLNRRKDSSYPKDVCSVIFELNAFSWTSKQRHITENERHIFLLTKVYVDAVIDGLNDGSLHPITQGATHYHANYVKPCWVTDMQLITTLGKHKFYKQKRTTGACVRSKSKSSSAVASSD